MKLELQAKNTSQLYREASARERHAEATALFERLSCNAGQLSPRDGAILDALGWAIGEYDTEPRVDFEEES